MKTRYRSAMLVEPRRASPETRLWGEVIVQAFSDSLCRVDSPNDVLVARRWLLFDRNDFYRVCEFAGVEPSDVRQKARALNKNGWAAA